MNKLRKWYGKGQKGEGLTGSVFALVLVSLVAALAMIMWGVIGNGGSIATAVSLLEKNGYTILGPGVLLNGDLIPSANNTYNIGNPVFEWRNGYFAGNVTATNFIGGGLGSGNVTANGTVNSIPQFSTSTNITNSSISNNGTWTNISNNVSARVGRGYTHVIATSDATATEKAQADLILTGTAGVYENPTSLQALLTAGTDSSSYIILGQNCYFSTGIVLPDINFLTFKSNAVINYNGTGVAVTAEFTNKNKAYIDIADIVATGAAIPSGTAEALRVGGISFSKIQCLANSFKGNIGFNLYDAVNIVSENNEYWLNAKDCLRSIYPNGAGTLARCTFRNFTCEVADATLNNVVALDVTDATSTHYLLHFDSCICWVGTNNTMSFMKGLYTAEATFDEADVHGNGYGSNFTMWDGVKSDTKCNLSNWNTVHNNAKMYNTNLIYVGRWERDNVLQPSLGLLDNKLEAMHVRLDYSSPNVVYAYTHDGGGTTFPMGNGEASIDSIAPYDNATCWWKCSWSKSYTGSTAINFNKPIVMRFIVDRQGSDAESVHRLQLKSDAGATRSAMTAPGIGIEILNMALRTESYGAARESSALAALSDAVNYDIVIIHYPGVKIEWYVDGVLTVADTTLNTIPSGDNYSMILLQTSYNGASGGTALVFIMSDFEYAQVK
jgi:hypothetical protein